MTKKILTGVIAALMLLVAFLAYQKFGPTPPPMPGPDPTPILPEPTDTGYSTVYGGGSDNYITGSDKLVPPALEIIIPDSVIVGSNAFSYSLSKGLKHDFKTRWSIDGKEIDLASNSDLEYDFEDINEHKIQICLTEYTENNCKEIIVTPVYLDTDGDGVRDNLDKCITDAGPKKLGGCPDSDGDGVIDKQDNCPNENQGKYGINGCPDRDGDGILDSKDNCPKTAQGKNGRQGCPDSDGDGLLDINDGCPKEYGPKSNNGCKKVSPTPTVVKYLNTDKDVKYALDQISNGIRAKASFINSSHPYKTRFINLTDKASRTKTTQKLSFINECKSLKADIESARAPVLEEPKLIPKVAEKVTQEMAESRMTGKPSRLNIYSECPGVSSNGPFTAQISVKPSRYLNLVSMVVYSASDNQWKAIIKLLEDNKQVGIITGEDILDGETTISLTEFGYILVPGKTYKLEISGGGKLRNLKSCGKKQSSDASISIDQSSVPFISKLNYNY